MKIKTRTLLIFLLFFAIVCSLCATIFKKNSTASDEVTKAVLNVLKEDSSSGEDSAYLSDEEFITVLNFVKQHEDELKYYKSLKINDDYSIFIDRTTRKLFLKNAQGMIKSLTFDTIDFNYHFHRNRHYDRFVKENDRTYCLGYYEVGEYYLGNTIAEWDVPLKYPTIIEYDGENAIITELLPTTEEMKNQHLIYLDSNNNRCISISDNFSGLPVKKYENRLYYIDNKMSLYVYDIETEKNTFIANDVYDIFIESTLIENSINFRSKTGIYTIDSEINKKIAQKT